MRNRYRLIVLWLAAAFVLAGAALGFAQGGSNHGTDVSKVAKPTVTPAADDHGDEVSDAAKKDKDESADEASDHERKHNHGFFVSSAAQCNNVDDPDTATNPDFTAPADCDSNGQAHGEYVRSVAHSDLGKSHGGHGHP